MNSTVILFIILISIYFLLYLLSNNIIERHLPFYSSPPKRWGGHDLRCYPYIPKKLFPWHNSSYNYYYRPRCLVGRM
jgi:hypothetical protein